MDGMIESQKRSKRRTWSTLPEMARMWMRHTLRALVQMMHLTECTDNTQTVHKAPRTARARPIQRPSASRHSGLVDLQMSRSR